MSRTYPAGGRHLRSMGESSSCITREKKEFSLQILLVITMAIIGAMITGTIFLIKQVGNPLDYLQYFSRQDSYTITQASEDLPVSRVPVDSISLEKFVALRYYFENQQFETLNIMLEGYQGDFEKNPAAEYKTYDAFRVFAATLPRDEDLFSRWVRHSPDHYAPYLARANYYYAKGWESRGTRFAADTTAEQFSKMRWFFQKTVNDLDTALNINPNLLQAHYVRISIYNATGDNEEEDKSLQRALELFPDSFLIHTRFMWAKSPRWGGTYRTLENFAKEAEQHAGSNPVMTALYGFIYYDQSKRAVLEKAYKDALKLCTKAISYGDNWLFYKQRARIYHYYLKKPQNALIDIDRSIYLRPTQPESYLLRSKIYFSQDQMQNALDDILTAELIKPGDSKNQEWRTWAGKNLMNRGHKIFKDAKGACNQGNKAVCNRYEKYKDIWK